MKVIGWLTVLAVGAAVFLLLFGNNVGLEEQRTRFVVEIQDAANSLNP